MVRRHRIDDGIRVINNRLFFCCSLLNSEEKEIFFMDIPFPF